MLFKHTNFPVQTKLVIKVRKSQGNKLILRITNNKYSVTHNYKFSKSTSHDNEKLKRLISLFLKK